MTLRPRRVAAQYLVALRKVNERRKSEWAVLDSAGLMNDRETLTANPAPQEGAS